MEKPKSDQENWRPQTVKNAEEELTLVNWFKELKQDILKRKHICKILFKNHQRCAKKTDKVLAHKVWQNMCDLKKGSEKEAFSVLLVFSAASEMAFPYSKPPYKYCRHK